MESQLINYLTNFLSYGILFYTIAIMTSYLILAFYSISAVRYYIRKNRAVYYDDILRSPLSPSISIIAPAYNEGATIIENIRSLLSLHYNNYEIIIINDGSKDDTLEQLIQSFELTKVDYNATENLAHKQVLGYYISKNKSFKKLKVIDKINGGKADAMNAGIIYSSANLVACIDVDCIIEDDALLKLVKPFLERVNKKMIGTGGVVRIANDCVIKQGRLIEARLPKKLLPLFQTLEYMRAFLLGRMAWSRLNGLLIISGAFGLFDRKILVESNGFEVRTVGEDMELVVRMRKNMADKKVNYKVEYVPDPLCWTQAPETIGLLINQRNRWTRGLIETLQAHRNLFFNRKYGILGTISYPFWVFFEWLAPIIEFLGLIYVILMAWLGYINWNHFWLLLLFVYSFSVMYSWLAILVEETTFREYTKKRHLFTLLFIAVLEPIFFHPFTVYAAISGNLDKLLGRKKKWGTQKRKAFV